jgi:hypothetical protein
MGRSGPYPRIMDKQPTRLAIRIDQDRLRGLPETVAESYEKFLRDLGLKPGWVAPGAEVVIDTAAHTVTTRYVIPPEGTDGRTAHPDTIPDGNGMGGVLTTAHVEKYDAKTLPEIPPELRFALADNEQRTAGIHGATGAI